MATGAGSYLKFFRVQHGTVEYLRAPEFVVRREDINMWSLELSDYFEQERGTSSLKMSDIFKLMFSNPACVTHVREGDCGFESLFNDYGDHAEFFKLAHEDVVYVIAAGYAYAKIVDVR